MEVGLKEVNSFCILSAIPGYMVVATREDDIAIEITTDIEIALEDGVVAIENERYVRCDDKKTYVVSWIPAASRPNKLGWNNASGARNRSLPMVMT